MKPDEEKVAEWLATHGELYGLMQREGFLHRAVPLSGSESRKNELRQQIKELGWQISAVRDREQILRDQLAGFPRLDDLTQEIDQLRRNLLSMELTYDDYLGWPWGLDKEIESAKAEIQQAELRVQAVLNLPATVRAQLITAVESYSPSPFIGNAISRVEELTPALIEHLKVHVDDLRMLDPTLFEKLIAEILAQRGFYDVVWVGRNRATTADIFATTLVAAVNVPIRFYIEVKRTESRVGIEVINAVHGAMLLEREKFGCHLAMIVSLGGFPDKMRYSQNRLSLRGVELKDKDDIHEWLRHYRPAKNGLWLPQDPTQGI